MILLDPLEQLLSGPGARELAFDDGTLEEILALANRGRYASAAEKAEQLWRQQIYDVRTLGCYLLGVFVERGITSLGPILTCVQRAVGPNRRYLSPQYKRERHLDVSLRWLFDSVVSQISFHEQQKDEVWKKWTDEWLQPGQQLAAEYCTALLASLDEHIPRAASRQPLLHLQSIVQGMGRKSTASAQWDLSRGTQIPAPPPPPDPKDSSGESGGGEESSDSHPDEDEDAVPESRGAASRSSDSGQERDDDDDDDSSKSHNDDPKFDAGDPASSRSKTDDDDDKDEDDKDGDDDKDDDDAAAKGDDKDDGKDADEDDKNDDGKDADEDDKDDDGKDADEDDDDKDADDKDDPRSAGDTKARDNRDAASGAASPSASSPNIAPGPAVRPAAGGPGALAIVPSPPLQELLQQLSGFVELVRRKRFTRAEILLRIIRQSLQRFEPTRYFPSLFTDYLLALASHAKRFKLDPTTTADLESETLQQLCIADLNRFLAEE